MQVNLSYFIVEQSHLLSLTDTEGAKDFTEWVHVSTECIRLPWGDSVYSLESHVVEDEEYDNQEEVFSLCNLATQNLIYQLKQIQLKDNPDSYAELVFNL